MSPMYVRVERVLTLCEGMADNMDGLVTVCDIPHVIHYCWFGGNPLGEKETRCIESWKRFLPDYDIKRWDESNFDVRCCDYVSEAYDAKKWAFVSDYARYKILYEEGGLYFDTDVEVVANMDDIIDAGPFLGIETNRPDSDEAMPDFVPTVNPGLGMGSQAGSALYHEVLDSYESGHFLLPDGSYDLTTVVVRTTNILRGHGLRFVEGVQRVAGINIYPSEFFNPKDFWTGAITTTGNTKCIHHFSMSWLTPRQIEEHQLAGKLMERGCSRQFAENIAKWYMTIRYLDVARVVLKLQKK